MSALGDPMQAWMARGVELNAIYDALTAAIGRSPAGDPVADIKRLGADRDRFGEALEEIRNADPVDMALDPNWPARIAADALASPRTDAREDSE